MGTVVWHDLGPADGVCTVCGARDALTLGEARSTRTLLERLRREYCAPPARFLSCRDCGWRWPVRADDRTADGVRRRGSVQPEPELPQVPPARRSADVAGNGRTVLPQQAAGRDWAYPRR